MLDVYECPVCIQSSLLVVKERLPGCKVLHDLVVILSTDLSTFISNISGSIVQVTTQCEFSPPLRGSPLPPNNHPFVITCGAGQKAI